MSLCPFKRLDNHRELVGTVSSISSKELNPLESMVQAKVGQAIIFLQKGLSFLAERISPRHVEKALLWGCDLSTFKKTLLQHRVTMPGVRQPEPNSVMSIREH